MITVGPCLPLISLILEIERAKSTKLLSEDLIVSSTSEVKLPSGSTCFSKYILTVAPEEEVPETLKIILEPSAKRNIQP